MNEIKLTQKEEAEGFKSKIYRNFAQKKTTILINKDTRERAARITGVAFVHTIWGGYDVEYVCEYIKKRGVVQHNFNYIKRHFYILEEG